MKRFLFSLCAAGALTASAVEWKNLDEDHRLGGRKTSAGYLQGKVVLVDRWGAKCPPCRAMLPRTEEIWSSFKNKQFVAVGGHCPGWGSADAVKKVIEETKVTFPVYEGAGLASGEPPFDAIPWLYVVDETGRVVYRGRDDKDATQAIVDALTDMESPKNLAQWKRFLDYELENLPAHAYNRMKAFRKRFPKEAKEYAAKERELAKVVDVKKVAELVEFAKIAKDPPNFGPKDSAKKRKYETLVKSTVERCASLKNVADPRLKQEAKNALADLVWAKAAF